MKTLDHSNMGHRFRHFAPIFVAAIVGSVLTLTAWFFTSTWEKRYAESEFINMAEDQALALQNGLKEYLSKMIAVRALFNASNTVNRKEFGIFSDTLLHDQTAILGYSWVPRIRRDERSAHEQAAVLDGLTDYRIKAIAPDGSLIHSPEQDEYYPVFYSNALSKASVVLGLDMNSEAGRRAVLERARDADQMATSPQVILRSTGTGDRHGFFVLMPVYQQGLPHDTVEDRRRNLVGYVNGVFQTGVMFDTILGSATSPLDLFLFEEAAPPDAPPIHLLASPLRKDTLSPKSQSALAPELSWSGEITVGDARWTLVAVPTPGGLTSTRFGRAWIMLIAGVSITGILVAYLWALGRYARDLEAVNKKVLELAQTDSLTALANRRAFHDRLALTFAASKRGAEPFAILYLDLDGFKAVNDTLGHHGGDSLLMQVADRLRACTRETDTVARLGGDEFVVLQTTVLSPEDVTRLAKRILQAVSMPYDINGNPVVIRVSIGIAVLPSDGASVDELLGHADLALYRAKFNGGNVFCFFDLEMGQNAVERVRLEMELRQALAAGEFEVHYQPIVSTETRCQVGAEALVRWRHPLRGLISPERFIPLAEKTGLINPLGEWVLRQACMDAVKWPPFTKVAVNLSPVQFKSPDLASNIARILSESKLPPERLELEITESVLLQRSDNNIGTLHELRDLGVSIALDDFGTGYSSLSYLRMFPFDKIKIDRSFVSEMSQLDSCAAIVCAVANLGRSLDIITTAEGVETEEQLELVRAAGCTQAQGYLLGRPCPVVNLDFDKEIAWTPAENGTVLTARDVMLVRTSFSLVVPIQDSVSGLFYDRLFAVEPKVRRLFPDDLSGQKHKLMALLATCVGKLHDFSTFAPVIKSLGARHAAYGAKTEHYAIVGESLLWALQQGLDDAFTPEIRSAWTKVYEVLATTMQAGAADAAGLRAAS